MSTFRTNVASRSQTGLTLIELMVALALGTLIALAAVSALIVARQGFKSVDSGSQLRENSRFAANLIQRVVIQAGFENAAYGFYTDPKDPGLQGFDDALVGDISAWGAAPTLAHGSRSTGCGTVTDTSCLNGSDVLVVRYWGVGTGSGDGTMINCAGEPEPEGSDRAYSIFHVVRASNGEPTLACTYKRAGAWRTVPLATGVEGFQVLYGTDTRTGAGVAGEDSVADQYLTATQLDTSPTAAVIDNWRRVRSVRIGLVTRGSSADAVNAASTAASMAVLGAGFLNSTDVGSELTVAGDGRIRQRLVFTVHLRNAQFAP